MKQAEVIKEIIALLQRREELVSTAESCTGGLVGAAFTEISGSSNIYEGGIISYSNTVKNAVLHVDERLLQTVGAVSPEVAIAMAEGTRKLLGTHYGLSTTGIAGPGGGSPTKQVGLVYSAIAGEFGSLVFKDIYEGSRQEVREQTVSQLLIRFLRCLKEND